MESGRKDKWSGPVGADEEEEEEDCSTMESLYSELRKEKEKALEVEALLVQLREEAEGSGPPLSWDFTEHTLPSPPPTRRLRYTEGNEVSLSYSTATELPHPSPAPSPNIPPLPHGRDLPRPPYHAPLPTTQPPAPQRPPVEEEEWEEGEGDSGGSSTQEGWEMREGEMGEKKER
eukprot:Sspe_Gene.51870::Locus_28774_Transcript_1_1_Confidence_1.000_Length_562::g.51870::m.51870